MKFIRDGAGRRLSKGLGRRLVHTLLSSTRRAALVVTIGLLLAAFGAHAAAKLTIDGDFSKLIPSHYSSVRALERLRTTVGGESEASVVIESPSFAANVRFAEAFIPEALALRTRHGEPYFTRVDYKRDVGFLERNALYLATDRELDSIEVLLAAEIESARLEVNPFYFSLDEDVPEADSSTEATDLQASYERLVGKEYPVSADSTTLVLRFYPGGTQTNIEFIEGAYESLQATVDRLDPSTYGPDMEVILAGRLLRQLIEVRAITDDVRGSFGVGVLTVLLMVTAYFAYKSYRARCGRRFSIRHVAVEIARAPVTAATIGVPLVAALCWTFGSAYLAFGTLNLMTSTLGLVLFGLGIDYGIHFFGRYAEERARGLAVLDAIRTTVSSTGRAVTVTALTTSASFFVLTAADFRGFSEFGFVAGIGIVYALLAMSIFLPALIIVFERLRLLHLSRAVAGRIEQPRSGPTRFPAAHAITLAGAVVFALSLAVLPRVSFEYDFGKLDPVYAEYQDLQRHVRKVYDDRGRRNPAYVVVNDPSEVAAVEAALVRHAASDTLTPTIGEIETLQRRLPETVNGQQAKLERIAQIRRLLDDPFLRQSDNEWLGKLRLAASTTEPVALSALPDYVRSAFTARDGSVGRIVVIYPSVGLSDGRQSMAFADDVATIRTDRGSEYHAGSTSLVAADMLRLMQREAPVMVALTLLVVFGIKLALLRSVRLTAIAMLPLLGGFSAMFGLAAVLHVSLNFYNLVVLPVVLGISDDAGIHLVHRYHEEGRGSILRVLGSTGEHISMSALTTMVGFGGLLLSFYPGLRSIGVLAVLGIGVTLVFAIVGLPALLQYLEDRDAGSAGDPFATASACTDQPLVAELTAR